MELSLKKVLEMAVPKEMKTIDSLRKNRLGLPDIQLSAVTLQLSPPLPEHRRALCQLSHWGHGALPSPAPPNILGGIQGVDTRLFLIPSPCSAQLQPGNPCGMATPLPLPGTQSGFCNWERVDVAGSEAFPNGSLNGFLALRMAFCSQFGLKRFHSLQMIGQSVICFLYRHNCFLFSLCLRGIIMERQSLSLSTAAD